MRQQNEKEISWDPLDPLGSFGYCTRLFYTMGNQFLDVSLGSLTGYFVPFQFFETPLWLGIHLWCFGSLSLNGQFHFLTVSNSVVILSSILAVIGLNILFNSSSKTKNRFGLGSTGSDANNGGNDIDVTFSTVTRYLNDQHFTHGSADVSLGEASVYFDNCRIEGPVCPV